MGSMRDVGVYPLTLLTGFFGPVMRVSAHSMADPNGSPSDGDYDEWLSQQAMQEEISQQAMQEGDAMQEEGRCGETGKGNRSGRGARGAGDVMQVDARIDRWVRLTVSTLLVNSTSGDTVPPSVNSIYCVDRIYFYIQFKYQSTFRVHVSGCTFQVCTREF